MRELVEPGRAVGAEAARQDVALPDLGRERDALERHQRLAQAVGAGARRAVRVDVLPLRQKAGQLDLIDRLGLLAQVGQARPAKPAQDLGVAPLASVPAGQQLAANQRTLALELAQRRGRVDAVALGRARGRERPVGARVAAHQGGQRALDVLEVGLRQARRRGHAERVAVQAGVLGGDPALLARDPHPGGAALGFELAEHRLGRVALGRARLALGERQVAQAAQDLLEGVAVGRPRLGLRC